MKYSGFSRFIAIIGLVLMLLVVPIVGVACRQAEIPASSSAAELAATMVPNTDIDVYIYIKQGSPTRIPKDLINAQSDITVDSLSIWGVAKSDDNYSIGGALTFANATDAARVKAAIPAQTGSWTDLSDRTIYFVQSLGDKAENLKSAISKRDFKPFNDSNVLEELVKMPAGGSTKPFAIGVIKPNKALVNLLKRFADANTAQTIDTVFTWAKPQVITFGLYSSQQIDVADIAQRALGGTIWDADLGMVASVKSGVPGFIVGPVATRILGDAGYSPVSLGNITVYKGSLNIGRGVPLLLNVEGNRVFVTVSGKETYAQTLMTVIRR